MRVILVICMTTLKRRSLKKFDFLDKTSNMVGVVWGRGGKALEEGDSYEIWGRGGVGGGGTSKLGRGSHGSGLWKNNRMGWETFSHCTWFVNGMENWV